MIPDRHIPVDIKRREIFPVHAAICAVTVDKIYLTGKVPIFKTLADKNDGTLLVGEKQKMQKRDRLFQEVRPRGCKQS